MSRHWSLRMQFSISLLRKGPAGDGILDSEGSDLQTAQDAHTGHQETSLGKNQSPDSAISLPQEIFDAIIEEVRDSASLTSCALVGTPFLSPSQRNIFRRLSLHRGQSHRHPSLIAAADFFAAYPHLASYVRDLSIELPDTALDAAALQVVLRLIQNIERLVVLGKSVSWKRLGPETASALLDTIALPSLSRLHLFHIQRVPMALIAAAVSIPIVSFNVVSTNPAEEPEQLHDSVSAPRLRHLTLLYTGLTVLPICNFLLHPRYPPYTSRVERLEIRIDQFSGEYDQRLLTACAGTLKHLAIDPGGTASILRQFMESNPVQRLHCR
jgi:hypothetical protein